MRAPLRLLSLSCTLALGTPALAQQCIDFSTDNTPFSLGGLGCGQTFFPEDVAGYAGQATLDLLTLSFWTGNLGGAGHVTTYVAIYDGDPDTSSLVGTSTNFIDTSAGAGLSNYVELQWTFNALTLNASTEYWAVLSNSPNDVNPTNTVGRSLQEFDHIAAPNDAYRGTSIIADRSPHGSDIDLRFEACFAGGNGISGLHCDPANSHSGGGYVTLGLSSTSGPGVLHLEATDGPAGEFAYFLISATVTDPGVAISNGRLCLGAPTGRYAPAAGGTLNSIGQFDAAGVLQNLVGTSSVGSGYDVLAMLPNPPGGMITAGDTWYFQCWYRDGQRSNFSNVVEVAF